VFLAVSMPFLLCSESFRLFLCNCYGVLGCCFAVNMVFYAVSMMFWVFYAVSIQFLLCSM